MAAPAKSDYEAERLRNIAANQAKLRDLGLHKEPGLVSRGTSRSTAVARPRKRRLEKSWQESEMVVRRSQRSRGIQPDYTGEVAVVRCFKCLPALLGSD